MNTSSTPRLQHGINERLSLEVTHSEISDKIKDTPKENKPPNKGQAESARVYTLYRKSPLKEDNLSTKDIQNSWFPKVSLLRGFTAEKNTTKCTLDLGKCPLLRGYVSFVQRDPYTIYVPATVH